MPVPPRRRPLAATATLVAATSALCLPLGLAGTAAPLSAQQELLAQSEHELPAEQDTFWRSILDLCGQAFERIDAAYVMHVRQCYPDEIRIPVHVGN
jgi:hypothetical protein